MMVVWYTHIRIQRYGGKVMATKRSSLEEGLRDIASDGVERSKPAENVAGKGRTTQRSDRQNTRLIAGHFDIEVSKQLRHIALDQDTTLQELLREGINYVFAHYGKPEIA